MWMPCLRLRFDIDHVLEFGIVCKRRWIQLAQGCRGNRVSTIIQRVRWPRSRSVCSREFSQNNPKEHDRAYGGSHSRWALTHHSRIPKKIKAKWQERDIKIDITNLELRKWTAKPKKEKNQRVVEFEGLDVKEEEGKGIKLGMNDFKCEERKAKG